VQKYLRTWSKMAIVGAAVLLAGSQIVFAAPQDAAAKPQDAPAGKQKAVKDNQEYDIYNDVIKDANPQKPDYKKLMTDLDTWKSKYPTTDYQDERDAYYIQAYAGTGQFAKAVDAAKALTGSGVAGLKAKLTSPALILTTLYPAVAAMAQLAASGTPTADQLDTGDKLAHLLMDYSKEWFAPENTALGIPADQRAAGLKQMNDLANGTLLQIALYPGLSIMGNPVSKDATVCGRAEVAFVKALQDRPDSGMIARQLAGAYLCQRSADPKKTFQALYEYARAVGSPVGPPFGLSADDQKKLDTYLTSTYTTIHGSADGLAELKDMAKNAPLPPADFKIKTAAEIAAEKDAEFQKNNPQLALWASIKTQLDAQGAAYFDGSLKDTNIQGEGGAKALRGKVVAMYLKGPAGPAKAAACNPNELTVAIPAAGQPADVPVVRLHLESALKGKVEPGADVMWDGVGTAFTKEPFMLTMDVLNKDAKDAIVVATSACPAAPVQKKSAPAGAPPASKKKGGE
jgi:hypothetical protein